MEKKASSASKPKGSDSRFRKVIQTMKQKFDDGNFYEGQQILHTIHARLMSQKKYKDAEILLSQGAMKLLSFDKTKEGVEIVKNLIEVYEVSNTKCTAEIASMLNRYLLLIPVKESECFTSMMKDVKEWVFKKGMDKEERDERRRVLSELHRNCGVMRWKSGDYQGAVTYLVQDMREEGPEEKGSGMPELFQEWIQGVGGTDRREKERPFFITKIVLQYLFVGNIQGAKNFIRRVCGRDDNRGPSFGHPLENMCVLLCEVLEMKSVVLFKMVEKTYYSVLKVDEKLYFYFQRVGEEQLQIPAPKGARGGGGLLGNVLSMLS